MKRKMPTAAGKSAALPAGYAGIHGGIVELLDAARQAAARSVNALMTASYWEIGRRIVEAEQKGTWPHTSVGICARMAWVSMKDSLRNPRDFRPQGRKIPCGLAWKDAGRAR